MFSQYVSKRELLKSDTAARLGLTNEPTKEHWDSLYKTCKLFDIIRTHFGVPIAITGGYRSKELNAAIPGSSLTSQHCKGEALDIDADVYGKITNSDIFYYVKEILDFDQLIWEYGDDMEPAWVHISLNPVSSKNRNQVLTCYHDKNGDVKYKTWHYLGS